MNKLIEQQLSKVEKADLTNYNKVTNTYFIPIKKDIKLEEDKCYLVKLEDTLFNDESLKINWNNGNMPKERYLKIDISKIMAKMIKVVAVGYDFENKKDIGYFWNGWLNTKEIKIIEKL